MTFSETVAWENRITLSVKNETWQLRTCLSQMVHRETAENKESSCMRKYRHHPGHELCKKQNCSSDEQFTAAIACACMAQNNAFSPGMIKKWLVILTDWNAGSIGYYLNSFKQREGNWGWIVLFFLFKCTHEIIQEATVIRLVLMENFKSIPSSSDEWKC